MGYRNVQVDLGKSGYQSRVWIDGEEWSNSIISLDINTEATSPTTVTMTFYAEVNHEH